MEVMGLPRVMVMVWAYKACVHAWHTGHTGHSGQGDKINGIKNGLPTCGMLIVIAGE
jgi:hypothetical protein